jgi:diguanylate cyclase (GGDEF)-like protein
MTRQTAISVECGSRAEDDADAVIAALAGSVLAIVQLDADRLVISVNEALRRVDRSLRQEPVGKSLSVAFPEFAGPDDDPKKGQVCPRWVPLQRGGWLGIIDPPREEPAADGLSDALTGLGNRRMLDHAFQQMRRSGPAPVALVCVDLDRFKQVNDTLGHPVGDKLLQKVGGRLRHAVRAEDSICRVGGDEFVILLKSPDGDAAAEEVAARIVDLIGRPFVIEGHQISVGASLGLSLVAPEDASVSDAFRRADIALYESKRKGRGQFQWYAEEMAEALALRRLIETELRAAILREEFELYFQPQFDASVQNVIGFEALVRWNHPTRGLLSPAVFLPICEESGLILELGAWVLHRSCQAAAGWPEHVTVAVNVSPLQFVAKGFVESVAEALAVSRLAPHRLELEVTESVLLGQESAVGEQMSRLQALGVTLSLDDFGTGYSSLSYLHTYPFQKVKIDQSFVRGSGAKSTGIGIVKAVADLGKTFGMKVLAEGVETADQYHDVTGTGCGLIQGYLIGRPLPQADIPGFLDGKAFLKGISGTTRISIDNSPMDKSTT